ncbi:hypothetical protein BYT27DRAFT_6639555 [Phlegmacium glaucopus]|nr:hypothetical protein BYT27DRAFT_6639555 [Phlegmacium glaucopus]
MKSEDQSTSTQPTTPTPTQAYPTQWASGAMAIDPILQQQSQSAQQQQHSTTTTAYQHYPYASHSHYPQAAYAGHYPYASPVTPQPTSTTTQQQQSSSTSSSQQPLQTRQYSTNVYTSANTNNGMDTADIATLNDALGSAGVDLRAEEESLQRSHDTHQSYRSYEDRTRKQPPKPSFDTRFIGPTMRTIGTQHKITRIPEESVNYLALALRARLQDLVTAMIAASHHRTDTQFDRPASFYEDGSPMWSIVVRSDVAKQLAALEKIEREEETKVRKERKERAEMTAAHAAALQAQANGMSSGQAMDLGGGMDDLEGGAKKKRKKDGPGVTARNMSEDVRKKMSNAVATQAAGLGGKYSWMTAANASTPATKAKPAVTTTTTATPLTATTAPATSTSAAAAAAAAAANSSWARPYVPTKKSSSMAPTQTSSEEDTRTSVTMRDAMFVVEKERGHGGGRGAARGWV